MMPNSRVGESLACIQKSCLRSTQSMPTNAVNIGEDGGFIITSTENGLRWLAETDMQAWVLQSQYREPAMRHALSIRQRTQAHRRIRNQSGKHHMFGSIIRNSPVHVLPSLAATCQSSQYHRKQDGVTIMGRTRTFAIWHVLSEEVPTYTIHGKFLRQVLLPLAPAVNPL